MATPEAALDPDEGSSQPSRLPAQRAQNIRVGGRQKAAVLLVSLGSDKAAEVFKHLRDDEIESLSLDMAKLDNVDAGISTFVFEELAATVQGEEASLTGGVDYAREVLERALGPDRALEIVGRLSSVIERRPFEFMRRTPPE